MSGVVVESGSCEKTRGLGDSSISDQSLPRSRLRSVWFHWGTAVAAVLVMIGGGWGTLQLWRAGPVEAKEVEAILSLGIADHIHCVMSSHMAERSYSPEKMAMAMGPDYIGLVSVLENTLPEDFQVRVAHQCSVNGRNYIHLVVKNQEKILSLIITRKEGWSFPSSGQGRGVDVLGMPLHQAHLRNLEVAGFETLEHFGFVVSGLNQKENYRIASELAPPVRDFLRKLEL